MFSWMRCPDNTTNLLFFLRTFWNLVIYRVYFTNDV